MFYIGIDLAWKDENETGIVMLNARGGVVKAGWTVGIEDTIKWLDLHAPASALMFVDVPLVALNAESTQRLCEKQVGQRYYRWKVSANSTHPGQSPLPGKLLLEQLVARGWSYHDGVDGPPPGFGRFVSECYPYTTIVGARELHYEEERPRYKHKRKPDGMPIDEWREIRNSQCDTLIERVNALNKANPPLDLSTHPETSRLVSEPSPLKLKEYKHREDLLDAAICAWTAMLWKKRGKARCQVLGCEDEYKTEEGKRATIIAPARPEQRGK